VADEARTPEGLAALIATLWALGSLPLSIHAAMRFLTRDQRMDTELAWAVLIDWVARHLGDPSLGHPDARAVLDARITTVPQERAGAISRGLRRHLSPVTPDSW
jgi:hypothetical protein